MKYLILAIFFISSLFAQSVSSCTLMGKSLLDFDTNEYIFIGEVIGYTGAIESAKLDGKAFGLIVKTKEAVYLPKTPKSHFEIFPVELWADCSFGGTEIEKLKIKFPLKSEIRVIAKAAEIFPNLIDGNIRLEDRPGELGSIALNYDENKNRMTSSNNVFDYKSFKFDRDNYTESQVFLPEFEIRKDLFRLKNSQIQTERDRILKRFLDVPSCCNNLDFYKVFKSYAANEKDFELLNETRLKSELTEEEFKQYKIVSEVTKELKKFGYSDTSIEKAVGQVINEGTEISKQKLLKRSLKILRKQKN